MKADEIRRMKDDELAGEIERVRRELLDLRTKVVTDQVEDTSRFGKTRKDVARLLTEKRRREIAASE